MEIESLKKFDNELTLSAFKYFQSLFILFWVFSFLGHYLEIVWSFLNHIIFSSPMWIPTTPTFLPLAPPYGLGVVAVAALTEPLIRRYALKPVSVFFLNTAISGVVEYLCAAFLVLFIGYNQFWNYSTQPFNLNGYICLKNTLVFGIVVTLFLYYIYPIYLKFVNRFNQKHLDILFWVLYISYAIDLIYLNLR